MLVLQRKKGQAVQIGDTVTIRITEVGADWVKLAIDAPREVTVLREELVEAAAVNLEAVRTGETETVLRLAKFTEEKRKNNAYIIGQLSDK